MPRLNKDSHNKQEKIQAMWCNDSGGGWGGRRIWAGRIVVLTSMLVRVNSSIAVCRGNG